MCNKKGKRAKREAELKSIQLHRPTGNYTGPKPRPTCDCQGWGCWGCCDTDQQIRSRQGIYG